MKFSNVFDHICLVFFWEESLRYNCDPFDEHSSETIWAALEDSQLASWVRERGGAEEPWPNHGVETRNASHGAMAPHNGNASKVL